MLFSHTNWIQRQHDQNQGIFQKLSPAMYRTTGDGMLHMHAAWYLQGVGHMKHNHSF